MEDLVPGRGAHPATRPLAPGLWVSYAHDPTGSWQQVQRGEVDASLRELAPSLLAEAAGKPVAPSLYALTRSGVAALE